MTLTNKTYKLTCWIKASAGLNNINCAIFIQNSGQSNGNGQLMHNNAITQINQNWKLVEFEFTTPNQQNNVREWDRLTFNIGHFEGSIYIDNLSVKIGSEELIDNGDFEDGTTNNWATNGGATVEVVPEGYVAQ